MWLFSQKSQDNYIFLNHGFPQVTEDKKKKKDNW